MVPLGPAQDTRIFLGHSNQGEMLSMMVTVKLQLVLRPWLSMAVQFTVVVPKGNKCPDGGVQVTVMFVSHWPVATG